MDITELVESHHIYINKLTPYLKKYRVRETTKPRNSKLTFHEDGFYATIRKKVAERLPHIVKTTPKLLSKVSIFNKILFVFLYLNYLIRKFNQSMSKTLDLCRSVVRNFNDIFCCLVTLS